MIPAVGATFPSGFEPKIYRPAKPPTKEAARVMYLSYKCHIPCYIAKLVYGGISCRISETRQYRDKSTQNADALDEWERDRNVDPLPKSGASVYLLSPCNQFASISMDAHK